MDGEQLQLSSRRPQGVHPFATRFAHKMSTKTPQNHENPPQMWHKSTISHGKKPAKTANVFEIVSTF